MRIATATNISSAILVFTTSAIALVLFWALHRMEQPYRAIQLYFSLKEAAAIDLRRTIDAYLASGDAMQLSAAEAQLERLATEHLTRLSATVQDVVLPPLRALKEGLTVKFRGAGKLGGDRQGLLLQAERELRAGIGRLVDYAREGHAAHPQVALDYLLAADEMNRLLQNLAHVRQQFMEGGIEEYKMSALNAVQELQRVIDRMRLLPRLGLMEKSEENDFAEMMGLGESEGETTTTERGDDIIDELASLSHRYPREWSLTEKQWQAANDSRIAINGLMDDLERGIAGAEAGVFSEWERIGNDVKRWLYLFTAAILMTAVFIHLFQRRVVLRAVERLRTSLASLVDTGRARPIDERYGNSEIGEVVHLFNRLFAHLSAQAQERDHHLQHVSTSLSALVEQVNHIHHMTRRTRASVGESQGLMHNLNHLATELQAISTQVETYARETTLSMEASHAGVGAMLEATRETSDAVVQVRASLDELVDEANEVSAMVDVMKEIADQTNLLALNAAIEAARAAEHGRGFAVVADEVRKLSSKAQGALTDIETILGGFKRSVADLDRRMSGIEVATSEQRTIADSLLKTARNVGEQASQSMRVAQQAGRHVQEQVGHVNTFKVTMDTMGNQAAEAEERVERIQSEMSQRVEIITTALGLQTPSPLTEVG